MKKNQVHKQLIPLLKLSVKTLLTNPAILFPLSIGVFIQLLTLEILYFSPRFPLDIFFGPIVSRIWAEAFLHYPLNFFLLPKLFYYAQIAIYLFIGSFLSAVAISMVASLNNHEKVSFKSAVNKVFPFYLHIFLAGLLSLVLFNTFSFLFYKAIGQAVSIEKGAGALSQFLSVSQPYFNLFIGVMATVLLAFVIPVIAIEQKKITGALWANFSKLRKSFWFIFAVTAVPTMLYIPVFLLRNNMSEIANSTFPEIQVFLILLGIAATFCIDTTVFTAATIYYLLEKEQG